MKKHIYLIRDIESDQIDAVVKSDKSYEEVTDLLKNIKFRRGWTSEKTLSYVERVYDVEILCNITRCHQEDFNIYF